MTEPTGAAGVWGFRVDCIIPCYNGAETVVAAIRSVLAQDVCGGVGVIVVDDGSTDDSVTRVRALADPRVRVISQPNRGPSAARNAGIRASQAPLCAFLDADDRWLPGKLALQLAALDGATDPAVVGHCVSFRQLWADGTGTDRLMPPSEEFRDALLEVCMTTIGSTLLVRRAVFERVGYFDEGLRCFEDWDWQWRCLLQGLRFETSPRVMVEKPEGRRRSGPVVEAGVAHMRHRLDDIRATLGAGAARRLAASLWFEQAVAAGVQRRWPACLGALIASLCAHPGRVLSSVRRVGGRLWARTGRGIGARDAVRRGAGGTIGL